MLSGISNINIYHFDLYSVAVSMHLLSFCSSYSLTHSFQLSGSLMVAGVLHAALGFTGLIGILLKFVGPITVVPCMVLITVFIVNAVLKLVQINWAIGLS